MDGLLWPTYDAPDDLAEIEAVPLADRGLPGTTYEVIVRAARFWPHELGVVAVVGVARGADETSVKETLDRFAITWRLEQS